jgi:CelD/BcsL family acetyltransferase involved in cellulose biosynthesis
MNRHEWEFEYTAATLADAAEKQRDYRTSRVAAWEAKKAEVMAKVKESGLTVHEGPAAGMSNYTNAIQGAHVMVDTTLQQDLSECVTKINAHRQAATSYDGWAQVLRANPEKRVALHQDDWLFFFGK